MGRSLAGISILLSLSKFINSIKYKLNVIYIILYVIYFFLYFFGSIHSHRFSVCLFLLFCGFLCSVTRICSHGLLGLIIFEAVVDSESHIWFNTMSQTNWEADKMWVLFCFFSPTCCCCCCCSVIYLGFYFLLIQWLSCAVFCLIWLLGF